MASELVNLEKGFSADELRMELNGILTHAFQEIIGQGYGYMDGDPWDMTEMCTWLINRFGSSQKGGIEKKINSQISNQDVFRIMDQGCGYGNSLRNLSERLARENPEKKFEGYGLSSNIDEIFLGRHVWKSRMATLEELNLIKKGFYPMGESDYSNLKFFGVLQDVHQAMKDFPHPLDLVFSDHAYFHFMAPWLALKRTADKLSVGGVALIRTLLDGGNGLVMDTNFKRIEPIDLIKSLREKNPNYNLLISDKRIDYRLVLGIIKKEDTPFKSNMYLLDKGHRKPTLGSFNIVYSDYFQPDLLSIDSL